MAKIFKQLMQAMVLGIAATTFPLQAYNFNNILERIKSPEITFAQVQKKAAEFAARNAVVETADDSDPAITKGVVQVGIDNAGNPISLGYLTIGNRTHNIGTIFCPDFYFGRNSYKKQGKLWAKQGFFVVCLDDLGYANSSKNNPEDLDGINGFVGYSYQQQSSFYRQALINLGVQPNTPSTPITFIGTATEGTCGVAYAAQYQDDPYGLSFLITENGNLAAVSSTNPCSVALLNPTIAAQVAAQYAIDPCGTICALYSGTVNQNGNPGLYTEVSCPDFGEFMLNLAVTYAATQPANIFERKFVTTAQFDPAPLFAQIKIPVLILTGGIYQLIQNKQNENLGLYGFCYGCQPGCTDSTYVLPFQNSISISYQNAGLSLHTTRVQRFNQDVIGFITGASGECDPEFGLKIDAPGAMCTECP